MSAHSNVVQDFPKRCTRLLELWHDAKTKDLEVTLLLAVAGQALIMPLERLDVLSRTDGVYPVCDNKHNVPDSPAAEAKIPHPSGDARTFKRAADQLSKLLGQKCNQSRLFRDAEGSFLDAWRYTECDLVESNSETFRPQKPIADKNCRTILKVLRHALAHGNLRTDGNPINRLVFLARKYSGGDTKLHYLQCDPYTLLRFLRAWTKEITNLQLDPKQVIEAPRFMAMPWLEDEAA